MDKSKGYIKNKLRRIASILTLLAVVFSVPAAIHAERLDLGKKCSVTVSPCGNTYGYASELESGFDVDLYLVATAKKVEGYDTYTYELTESFKTISIPDELDTEAWKNIAAAAREVLFKNYESLKTSAKTGKTGEKIGDLTAGLYLIVARGTGKDIIIRDGVTVVVTPKYEFMFEPSLVSLPTKDPEENDQGELVINTANDSDWIYDAQVVLKPTEKQRFGKLKIFKDLLTYKTGESATFAYLVNVPKGQANEAFTIAVPIFLSDATEVYAEVDKLPVGATVTVVEQYEGSTYKATSATTQTAVISADTVAEVHFENDYVPDHPGGYGILNTFTYDSEDGWVWEKKTQTPVISDEEVKPE